jgi:hypothetical protein
MANTSTSIHSFDKLDGTNYAWKFKIRMFLIDKDLWEVVDETEKDYFSFLTRTGGVLRSTDSRLVHVRSC